MGDTGRPPHRLAAALPFPPRPQPGSRGSGVLTPVGIGASHGAAAAQPSRRHVDPRKGGAVLGAASLLRAPDTPSLSHSRLVPKKGGWWRRGSLGTPAPLERKWSLQGVGCGCHRPRALVPRAFGGKTTVNTSDKCSQSGVTANTPRGEQADFKAVSGLPATPA